MNVSLIYVLFVGFDNENFSQCLKANDSLNNMKVTTEDTQRSISATARWLLVMDSCVIPH